MFVCLTIPELRFYGCSHPCLYKHHQQPRKLSQIKTFHDEKELLNLKYPSLCVVYIFCRGEKTALRSFKDETTLVIKIRLRRSEKHKIRVGCRAAQ